MRCRHAAVKDWQEGVAVSGDCFQRQEPECYTRSDTTLPESAAAGRASFASSGTASVWSRLVVVDPVLGQLIAGNVDETHS
jgi:hypothetical protein